MPRRRQSTAHKIATGAAKKNPQRVNTAEPAPQPGDPRKPNYIAKDEHASGKWDKVVAVLRDLQTLSKADGEVIALYCISYSIMQAAWKDGNVNAAQAALNRMMRLLIELGLTPASRSRVQVIGDNEADPLTQFMNK